jgi:hypothetical protein
LGSFRTTQPPGRLAACGSSGHADADHVDVPQTADTFRAGAANRHVQATHRKPRNESVRSRARDGPARPTCDESVRLEAEAVCEMVRMKWLRVDGLVVDDSKIAEQVRF